MERRVLSEAIQEQIADREIVALLFCTHDLDPEFFEQEILSVFLGNDLKHNRRTRQVQLEYAIRERNIPIDVYYEQRAIATPDGSARLAWGRHPMHGLRGVFHPKLVLALCEDKAGSESLVVSVASANLTPSGWWRNVECAEVVRLDSGARHGFVPGLLSCLNWLDDRRTRWQLGDDSPAALVRIRDFVSNNLGGYTNAHVQGRLVPQLLPGFDDLRGELQRLLGRRLEGAHLEVISPFLDSSADDVVERIGEWQEAFRPRTFKIAVPARDGVSTISEEVYVAVECAEGVSWARLPRAFVKAAPGEEASERSVHAKVYRFWRGNPDPLEVVVVGSHNFTGAAHTGRCNWEVSVVIESDEGNHHPLLEDAGERPGVFQAVDEDQGSEESTNLPYIPMAVSFDWKTQTAWARWTGERHQAVTLLRAGREVCRVVFAEGTRVKLDPDAAASLADSLRISAVLICRRDDGREAPLLVNELNHDLKPAVLDGLELTPAEIFALWSIPDLQERIKRIADIRGEVAADEDDIELVDLQAINTSMFERFAGVFQAFSSLRARVDTAMKERDRRRAALAVYAESFDSLVSALRLMRTPGHADLAHQYVTWASARLLDKYVSDKYPNLAEEYSVQRNRLLDELQYYTTIRQKLIESSDDPEMASFLDWFDGHFAEATIGG